MPHTLIVHPQQPCKSGRSRLTARLVDELLRCGCQVTVVTADRGGDGAALRSRDDDGFGLPPGTDTRVVRELIPMSGFLPERALSLGMSLRRAIHEVEPDLIINMSPDLTVLALAKLARRRARTVQLIQHVPPEPAPRRTRQRRDERETYRFPAWLNDRLAGAADHLLCTSRAAQEQVWRRWRRRADVVTLPLGRAFREAPPNAGDVREPLVLAVGRFAPEKRQRSLVDAFRRVRQRVRGARLVLAGSATLGDTRYLDELALFQNADVVIYLNPGDTTLRDLYRRARVLCQPQRTGGAALAPLEAMAQGAPVVAWGTPSVRELVTHGVNGFVAASDDELTDHLEAALTLPGARWLELQRGALRRARQAQESALSFPREVRTLLSFYGGPCGPSAAPGCSVPANRTRTSPPNAAALA